MKPSPAAKTHIPLGYEVGTGGPVTVTPPEKLRKDFQQAEVTRLLEAVRTLSSLAKQILKLVEAVDGFLTQPTIAKRLGRNTGGTGMATLGKAAKELVGLRLVESKQGNGLTKCMRATIAVDLSTYQPAEAEVEAVYQNVLHAIATKGDAAST